MRNNKVALYESIMRKVSRVVKNAINESDVNTYEYDNYGHMLSNSDILSKCRLLTDVFGCSMTDDENGVSLWSDIRADLVKCQDKFKAYGIFTELCDNWKETGDRSADRWRLDINY